MDALENGDEAMMPGFRFHPTDEELVSFYLKRKIQQKPLCIELIRQLDIYKYDPWDLPKLATTGEKEMYFYCPRDRKYRNSVRPNRVTGAGFWKATGTDKPIYSFEGTKCIGLKKSLVFYKGRAAKGTKTDWMMHEFRLPSLADASGPKRPLDHKNIPANESWAICRIFKKTTNSMANRVLSHSWVSPIQDTTTESGLFSVSQTINANQFVSQNIPSTTDPSSSIHFGSSNGISLPPLDLDMNFRSASVVLSHEEMPLEPMLLDFSQQPRRSNEFTIDLPTEFNEEAEQKSSSAVVVNEAQTISFPFSLTPNVSDDWRFNLPWDSSPHPNEMSTNFWANTCYT